MVDRMPVLVRQNLEEILFGLEWLFLMRLGTQRQPMRNTVDMGVDSNPFNDAETYIEHDIRRLASHTGKFDELLHVSGDLAAVIGNEHLRRRDSVLCLAFVKTQ